MKTHLGTSPSKTEMMWSRHTLAPRIREISLKSRWRAKSSFEMIYQMPSGAFYGKQRKMWYWPRMITRLVWSAPQPRQLRQSHLVLAVVEVEAAMCEEGVDHATTCIFEWPNKKVWLQQPDQPHDTITSTFRVFDVSKMVPIFLCEQMYKENNIYICTFTYIY